MVVWRWGRFHPSAVSRPSSTQSVPYSNAPAAPTQIFEAIFEDKFFYMLYFQPVGPAEAEFEADPRLFLRTMLYSAGGEGMASGTALPDLPREGTRFMDILTPAPEKPCPLAHRGRRRRLRRGLQEERLLRAGQLLPQHGRQLGAHPRTSPPSIYTMPTGVSVTGSLDPVTALMMPNAPEEMAAASRPTTGVPPSSTAPATGCSRKARAETNAAPSCPSLASV